MLVLREKSEENLRTLRLNDNVFHNALSAVLLGEKRFHVKNPKGEDFDLEFTVNNDILAGTSKAAKITVLPPYYVYDENDIEKLYMKEFDGFDAVFFSEVNEYSVVLAKLLIKLTDKKACFLDNRIYWFMEENSRLIIMEHFPDRKSMNAILCIPQPAIGYAIGDLSMECAQSLFHNVFVLQWLTNLPLEKVKNAEIMIPKETGIGGILSHFTRARNLFASLGIESYLKPESTRFGDDMLEDYFTLRNTPEDSDDSNTIYVTNFAALAVTRFFNSANAVFDENIMNQKFIKEIEEYKDGIIGGKKVLGVLARGTDYISGHSSGTRKHAAVEEMQPVIDEWMKEENYDRIFLATEDQDMLEKFRAAYGKKVIAIAQERHRVSDFKDNELIAELEKREKSGKEYLDSLMDTTANYFYALYILSCCDSFLASGQCNGWDTVNAFSRGKFNRVLKMQVEK